MSDNIATTLSPWNITSNMIIAVRSLLKGGQHCICACQFYCFLHVLYVKRRRTYTFMFKLMIPISPCPVVHVRNTNTLFTAMIASFHVYMTYTCSLIWCIVSSQVQYFMIAVPCLNFCKFFSASVA